MTSDLRWAFAFNLILNSFLAFVTVAFLAFVFLCLFRVKAPRFKALLLCVPLLKLVLDPFLYDFDHWALLHQMNPFLSEPGSRSFNVMAGIPPFLCSLAPIQFGMQLALYQNHTFSLADCLVLSLTPFWVRMTVGLFALISFISCGIRLIQWRRSSRLLSEMVRNSQPCPRLLQNDLLQKTIQRCRVRIRSSSQAQIPCAIGRKTILFPDGLLQQLTQEEFEAVLAHELSHLLWCDSFFRTTGHLLCSLFWWIPIKLWMQKIEKSQEEACDRAVDRYGIPRLALASALLITAKEAKKAKPASAACLLEPHATFDRVRLLMQERKRDRFWRVPFKFLAAVLVLSLLTGKFWMF